MINYILYYCSTNQFNLLLMKKIVLSIFLLTQITFAQDDKKIQTYNHGYNGMELIAKNSKNVVIVSTFNSKPTIREEIAQKVYSLFAENKLQDNTKYTINGDQANVTGKCIIKKRNNLIAVEFYYEKVEWYSGLIEVYKKYLG